MDIEPENDTDSDMVTLIPLQDQLSKCSDFLADDETFKSNSFLNKDNECLSDVNKMDIISEPSTSKCISHVCEDATVHANSFLNKDNECLSDVNKMDIISEPSTSKCISNVCEDATVHAPKDGQDEGLEGLGVSIYDQTQFESDVMDQVDKAMKAHEEKKRKEEVGRELQSVADDIRFAKKRLNHIEKALSMAPKDSTSMTPLAKRKVTAIKKEQENKMKHLKKLEAKQRTLQACISGNSEGISESLQENVDDEEDMDEETKYHLQQVFSAKETEEERLIRLGEMTPFGTTMAKQSTEKKVRKIVIPENELTDFDKFLLGEAEAKAKMKEQKTPQKHPLPSTSKTPPKIIISVPMSEEGATLKTLTDLKAVPRTKYKPKVKLGSKYAKGYIKKKNPKRALITNYKSDSDVSDYDPNEDKMSGSDDEYFPDQDLSDGWEDVSVKKREIKAKKRKYASKSPKKKEISSSDYDSDSEASKPTKKTKVVDDGDQKAYINRLRDFEKAEFARKQLKMLERDDGLMFDEEEDYTEFDEDFKIPNSIWNKLYKYQQTGVRWLWELHQQNCGGIIGDEMGLGKTIQVIAFLVGLKFSQLKTVGDNYKGLGPVILVCPATVMHQWVKECHTWWPPFRVAILHESGSFVGKKAALIHNINKSNGVLITSYAGIVQHQESLLEKDWHYIILDEGHKIRNPDAKATLAVKQFRTPHRLILSGSPVQNNLKELWSLFDFIFPGKLGTLPVFMQQFSVPIVQGGYANASQIQVQTAYKCATVLRDTIKPYLLRRMKSDVKMSINLPNKNEQVLFCQLTPEQIDLYKGYITSKEVDSILNARLQIFVGLINLRKICNHPDLFDGGPKIFKDTDLSTLSEEDHYGYYKRSGKMIVVEALLRLWHKQGHRVLLFTQSKQMMDILEIFVKSKGYTYMKMDGTTSIGSRQPLINKFNSDKSIFVFLLTTRVGGLGVNLTGADRLIIYDPDWNPSTDAQARERAWRIGQDKQVTIYRLLTAGTIEEKIYHRQIFKQFVTNRVLKDPRQRRFFKSNDMYELFTFQELGKQGTETSAIFAGTGSEVKVKKKVHQNHHTDRPSQKEKDSAIHPEKNDSVNFSAEKLEKMKLLAKKLSAEMSKKIVKPEADSNKDIESKDKKIKTENIEVKMEENSTKSSEKESEELSETKISFKKEKNVEQNKKDNKSKALEHSLKHSKKPKKRKVQEVDGEKIDFLLKKDVYKPPQEENEKSANDDDYVLSKLFKNTGVHSALKHDKILESSAPDYAIVEGEASRVAKEAIKALKESRRMCARAEEGIPTWTGQHGGTKQRFGQKKKLPFNSSSSVSSADQASSSGIKFDGKSEKAGALSSSDLLSAIQKRKKVFGTDDNSEEESDEDYPTLRPSVPQPSTEYDELLVEIRNFVAFGAAVDGEASTKELIDTFQHKLPKNQSAIFKSMLSKICDFSRSSDGEGIWYLKSEFR